MSDTRKATEGKPTLRMNAYYYSFDSTGVLPIDIILSAVACAGKAFHHTEDWGYECQREPFVGNNPIEWIQNSAKTAAETHNALLSQRAALVAALKEALPVLRAHTPKLSTSGTMVSLVAECESALKAAEVADGEGV